MSSEVGRLQLRLDCSWNFMALAAHARGKSCWDLGQLMLGVEEHNF